MSGHLGFRMALPFALFLGVAEVVRNWGDWGFWPFWVVDYLAVALLLWGWHAARSGQPSGVPLLAGAWGFTCAMFYMSFFGHLQSLEHADHGPIEQRPLTLAIGLLFAVTIGGFASSLKARAAGVEARRSQEEGARTGDASRQERK